VHQGFLELALNDTIPLELDYREVSTGENGENRQLAAVDGRLHSVQTNLQISDAATCHLGYAEKLK
jgi:hypothetical protein